MLPKRKNPFLTPSYGGRNGHKNPRLQRKDEIEEPPVDLSNPSGLPLRVVEEVQKMVEKKVEHAKKLVFRALKKARGFEKQKLVKRLKIAREKKEDIIVKKLELEFEVLKTEQIDLNSLASSHIMKTLSKFKPISLSPLFPPWFIMQKEPEGQLDERETAKRNLIARLYNSNPVKEEMVVVLGNVRKVMGMDEGDTKAGGKELKSEKGLTQVDGENEEDDGGGKNGDGEEQDQWVVKTLRGLKVRESTAQGFVEKASESVEEEWGGITDLGVAEDSEMDLDAFAAGFEDRLVGSSDEEDWGPPPQRDVDDGWSGGEEIDEDDYKKDTQNANPISTEVAPEKKSEARSKPKLKIQHDDTSIIPKSKRSGSPKPGSSTMSTFLPTLMSGYISGSDSDIDANYYKNKKGKKKGPAEPKERKNRMGQQARRALWEKKFGKNADHVKKGEAEQGRKKIEQRIKQSKVQKGDGAEKRKKSTEVEGSLHPSWEAARKTKEQQAKVQEAVMGKPMGKKIIFD